MSDVETLELHQALASDMSSLLHARIAAATPVEVLSDRGDKLLQIVEEEDGSRFVTRSFTDSAVRYVEGRMPTFATAWDVMHKTFADAGLEVVPSFLLEQEGDYPFVAVTEYIPERLEIKRDVTTQTKKLLAYGLGQLLRPGNRFLPLLEMINEEMFKPFRREDGSVGLIMVDIDPLMMDNPSLPIGDDLISRYVRAFGDLLWDDWCKEEEREVVLKSLVFSIDEALHDSLDDITSRVGAAFMGIHFMSNGLDQRGLGVFR